MSVLNAYLAFTAPMSQEGAGARYRQMFFAYGIHGIVSEWTNRDFRETPEELAALCEQ